MAGGRLHATTDVAEAAAADVVLVTVGTPVRPDGTLAGDQLEAACTALAPHVRRGQLVIVKSTVPPGATRTLVGPALEAGGLRAGRDFALAFTPERLAEGTALRELRSLPLVVGGVTPRDTATAAAFWEAALGVEVVPQRSSEAAEVVKLADNWWIDHNIALANELAVFCDLFDVDVLDVIAAANGVPKGAGNVNILTPSVGVGGSCLTKDPWMVWRSAADRGVDVRTVPAAREANDAMPARTAATILAELAALGKEPERSVVAVLGLAFKNDTGDLRATPVRGVVDELRRAGVEVRLHDPLVDPTEAAGLFGDAPDPDLEATVRDADCVAVLARHRVFDGIDFGLLPTAAKCVLLDGRAHYPAEVVDRLRDQGYVYRGIGRR